MHGTYLIEVGYKKGVTDPPGNGLASDVRHLGTKGVQKVTSAQLYRLIGDLTPKDRERIAQDLLCDPIIQEFHDGAAASAEAAKKSGKVAVIDVWYKHGVTDVVGESVLKGVKDLEVNGVSEVRTGMRYRLWGLKTEEPAKKIAWALLANPLVHDAIIHVD